MFHEVLQFMTRELKIGLLSVISLLIAIWGYTFLKGKNLLSPATQLKTTFSDVTGLDVSSPVLVNGYKIGTVTSIIMNPSNVKMMDVYFLIDDDFKIPKNSIANLKSTGIIEGKGIFITFEKPCEGADCAKNGDELQSHIVGFIEGMMGEEDVKSYTSEFSNSADQFFKNLGKEGQEGSIHATIRNLEKTTSNATNVTDQINSILLQNSVNLKHIIDNINTLTLSLAKSNSNIESMLANLNKVTTDLAQADIKSTIQKTNTTLDGSKETLADLSKTIQGATKTLDQLNAVMTKVNSGDGTLAKLMNDKQLYANIETTTKNLNLLLQDLRLNPKRYAHFSVFGKKQKEFTLPADDPALNDGEEK